VNAKPRALARGDRIAVVAPASTFHREEFDRGVEEIRRLGFEPIFDESVFARHRYLAGPATVRVDALRAAWRDRSVAGIIAVRGGFGSAQILPLLDAEEIRRARKPFIGYSDLTSLLTFITQHSGMVAFHGPMLDRRLARGVDGYDPVSFEHALCRREPMGELTADGLETIHAGEAAGPLMGGTVTQILASLGTPFAFAPPAGYVLFFDEVAERPYRLDRMVTQLRHSGLLARASAIVLGELPRCDEPGGSLTARSVVADLFEDFRGPILFGFPSGHTVGPAMTLPFGVSCRVIADSRPRLVIEEAAVE
jgi:muramoyltetrapeptide carboxypeptidase